MGSVKVEKFSGMLPAWDDRNIPDDQASFARNTYLYGGTAVGWRAPKLTRALLNSAAKYAYRIPVISQAIAQANAVFLGNPNAGDTVTVGEITYTWRNAVTAPYDLQRGSTTLISAETLFMALQYGSFDPSVVGANTPVNPAVAAAAPVLGFPYSFTSTTSTPGANTLVLVPIVPASTMKINGVNLVPAGSSIGAHFKGVLYENVNQINSTGTAYIDIPTTLAATGAEATGAVAGVPVTSSFTVPVTLIGGNKYWIGFIMDTAVPLQQATTGDVAVSNANTYANGPPNPFQTTNISGTTTGGTTVGSLQTLYNVNQPTWQIWASMSTISPDDAINTIGTSLVGGTGPYNYLNVQAPAFGSSFNLTPLRATGNNITWLSDLVSFADAVTNFVGGTNQTADTAFTGNSVWLEFLDQDTNVVRSPVVDDVFQRYYFASPSQPPQYNPYQNIINQVPAFLLGVPAPPLAPVLSTLAATGGNPTQIGFPGGPNANASYTFPDTLKDPSSDYQLQLILLPVKTSIGSSLNDIGLYIKGMTNATFPSATGDFFFYPVVFNDISATDATKSFAPGDLIAVGSNVDVPNDGTVSFPTAFTAPFSSPVTLTANIQYWIGVACVSLDATTAVGLGDANTQMYTATLPNALLLPGQNVLALPTSTTTGNMTAPPMTAGFVDLQMWGDMTPGPVGEAQLETRAYVYTWVTAYGEEGPPSPPALLDAYDNATWQLVMQPPLIEDQGQLRNIVSTNIYRTMSSVQGGTVFFYVGTVAANTTTFIDAVTDDVVAANIILPSTTWFGPPTTLEGLVSMPNGMIAGFRGNEVWFCEPFRPHAWPSQYVMTTDYPIVGLGVVGTTLVACTEANPQVFTGVSPSVMTQQRIPLPEPCTSRGGVLSTDGGVYYPSINGLVKVSAAGFANNITQSWITREKWDQLIPQKFVRAAKNISTYFAFGSTGVTNGTADNSVAQSGFSLELSEITDSQSFTNWPQIGGHRLGLTVLNSPISANIDNFLSDPWSGDVYVISGGNIYFYDFTDPAPTITPMLWRSKKFQGPHKDNFAALRVWFDIPPGAPQSPPPIRTTVSFTPNPPRVAQLAYKPGMLGVVRVIADGFYVTERELRHSTELMRVSSAQKYTTWQLEVEGVVSVTYIKMATSVKELGTVK